MRGGASKRVCGGGQGGVWRRAGAGGSFSWLREVNAGAFTRGDFLRMAFNLKKVLKALLLSSNQPLSVKDIQGVFTRFHEQQTMPLPGIVTDYAAPVETPGPDDVPVAPEESIEAPAVAEDSAAVEEPVEAIVDGSEDAELYLDVPSLITTAQIREAMDVIAAELRAADIFQPDLAICGGISEAMRIGAIAAAWNLKLAPHLWTGALAFAAGMHVAAASPAGWLLEYSVGANPLLQELAEEQFSVQDGMIEIPDRPGLGITIRQDFVDRYTVI